MGVACISGVRRAIRERVDGSLVVQVEIDPRFKAAFLKLFPEIDMPVALAPLVADFEKTECVVAAPAVADNQLKGGELARLAGQFCRQPEFLRFCGAADEKQARTWILQTCGVESRRELDHNADAAYAFHQLVRRPYVEARG